MHIEFSTLQIVEKVESLSNYDLEVRFGHLWCAKLNNHIYKVAVFPLELCTQIHKKFVKWLHKF